MATLPLFRYALDPTGTSPDNLVAGEIHQPVRRVVRVVAPTYGAFYTDSIVVTDLANNQVLVKGVQYYPAELYEVPTAKFGKEVCAIIVIKDTSVSDNISLQYQAVGGEFSTAADAVVNQILALENDNRPVAWGDVIGKPSEYPPSHHLHDIGDVYGFEYLVHAIERLKSAILTGDDYSHDQIYQYIDSLGITYQNEINNLNSSINLHLSDFNNPHHVTAAQVGTYTTGVIDTKIDAASQLIYTHAARTDNPHSVTAAQVGAYTTAQTYSATQIDSKDSAVASAANTNLVATANNLQGQINAHLSNTANPHQVTAAQVGAYSTSQTYSAAQIDAADNAVANNANANLVATANSLQNSINAHAGRTDNPHYVTAAQIGALTKAQADTYYAPLGSGGSVGTISFNTYGYASLKDATNKTLIIQWCSIYIGDFGGTDYYGNVTWPISFPNAVLQAFATQSNTDHNPNMDTTCGLFEITVSGAGYTAQDNNVGEGNLYMNFLAIGW